MHYNHSRSTASYIRKTLSELDDYMVSIKSNVTAINEFVRLQTYALKAHEENLSDVMVNLFK